MANSYVPYTGDGSTTSYTVDFDFLSRTEVAATVAGVPATFSWTGGATIQFDVAPANGAAIRIYRTTDSVTPKATFSDGSSVNADDLNANTKQALHIIQEFIENQSLTGVATPVGSAVGGTGQTSVSAWPTVRRKAARVAVTSNINVSSPGATLDSTAMSIGDRVLLTGQSLPAQNGLWVYGASLSRPVDYPTGSSDHAFQGVEVEITEGTYQGRTFRLTTSGTIIVGTTGATWAAIPLARWPTIVLNVLDYGATGNGVTDDTTAIQSAITAATASGQGRLRFPSGNYVVSSSLNISGSNIVLEGDQASIKATVNGAVFNIAGAGVGSEISNIRISGINQTATVVGGGGQHGVLTRHCRDVVIENCSFASHGGSAVKFDDNTIRAVTRNCYAYNIGVVSFYSEGDGTVAGANSWIWFDNNRVENFFYGVEVKETTDFFITRNQVLTGRASSAKYGILATRNYSTGVEIAPARGVITGNIVKNADYQGINVTQGADIVVADNVITGSGNTGLVVSGSHCVVKGNILADCQSGISVNYNSSVTGGAGGAAASYSSAYMVVEGNNVKGTTGNYSYSFNGCDYSTIRGNLAITPTYAGYAFYFASCIGTTIEGNRHVGGSTTYGFRYDDTNTSCTIRGNYSNGASTDTESVPASNTGWLIEDGSQQARHLARLQTPDATPATLFAFTIPQTNALVYIDAVVAVKSSSGSGIRGSYRVSACAYRAAGGATLQGTVDAPFSKDNAGGTAVTIDVNSNDVRVRVTGVAATNLLWVAEIQLVKRIL